jgi:hypothetical protein
MFRALQRSENRSQIGFAYQELGVNCNLPDRMSSRHLVTFSRLTPALCSVAAAPLLSCFKIA